ncbi:unnamed protein product, partial [marine sediment metagenome]
MKHVLFSGVTILLIVSCCGGIFYLSQTAAETEETPILINEVAFRENDDWIELKVATGGNYQGLEVMEGGSVIAALPDWDLAVSDFIIIHEEPGMNDTEIEDNNPGVWDLWGAGGLTATDNVLQIRNTEEIILDALIWSNDNGN